MRRLLVNATVLLAAACMASCSTMTAPQLFDKGAEKLKDGKRKDAYKLFAKAAKKAPKEPKYSWAAAQTAPDQNAAYVHTKDTWENGAKAPGVLMALSQLAFYTEMPQRLQFALSLYQQLPDSSKTQDFLSDVYFSFGGLDSSLAIRQRLYQREPTTALCNKTAQVLNAKGQSDKALTFLAEARKQKLLDATGYVMLASLVAAEYDFKTVDTLFYEAKRLGLYSEEVQLEHSGFLVAQERYDEAEAILKPLVEPVSGKRDALVNHRARIMLAYIYQGQRAADKLKGLIAAVKGDEPRNKAERTLESALLKTISDTTTVLPELKEAMKALPPNPVLTLVYAQENARHGIYKEAIAAYRALPALFVRSPRILTQLAATLALSGNDDDALGVISLLHKRNLFTKRSLEIFRDLTFKKQLLDKSEAAQALLEKQYSGDAGVRYSGGVMALRAKDYDKAQKVFAGLAKQYPKEPRFEVSRITVYMLKADYASVVRECKASSAPPDVLAPLLARAYAKLGDVARAQETYDRALAAKKVPVLMLEYADFLLTNNMAAKAAQVYQDLSVTSRDALEKDSAGNAVVLNNLAWALIQNEGFDEKLVLSTVQKAYDLGSKNPHIVDTYAEVLVKLGKFRDCEKILRDNPVVAKEPRLLFHLATAYEKDADINKAVRTYQDALARMDSTNVLPMTVSKAALSEHIDKLIGANK